MEIDKGFYIFGVSQHAIDNPRIYAVTLVFGEPDLQKFEPMACVNPVEKVHNIIRDPNSFYISRFPPFPRNSGKFFLGRPKFGVDVPSSPELVEVFEGLAPLWREKRAKWYQDRRSAFEEGMRKAGLTWDDRPKCPHTEDPDTLCRDCCRLDTRFVRRVLEHTEYPEPLLVKVEGLDNLLDSIPINNK